MDLVTLGTLTLVGVPQSCFDPIDSRFQVCLVMCLCLICLCGTGNDGCLLLTLLRQAEPFIYSKGNWRLGDWTSKEHSSFAK